MHKDSKMVKNIAKVFPFIPTGEYYFHRGIRAYNNFDLNKAKKYLKRAMELEPNEPMIACQLALVLTETLEYEQSNEILFAIIDNLKNDMTECHYFIANNFAYLGQFSEAYKHASFYLSKSPNGEFAHDSQELLDLIAIEQDEEFKELMKQDELVVEQDLARTYLEAGEFREAINILEDLIKQHEEYWAAYNNLALAYFYIGEVGKAEGILEKVLDSNPGNLHALCNQAVFLYYQHKDEELNELINGLEKVRPLLIEQQYKLGATLAFARRYEVAFHWLRKVEYSGFEEEANYYYWYARSAFFLGKYQLAEKAWKQLVEIDPTKAGIAPWEDEMQEIGERDYLASDLFGERMYGLYLISQLENAQEILFDNVEYSKRNLTEDAEREYLAFILGSEKKSIPKKCHEIAEIIDDRCIDLQIDSKPILLMLFNVYGKCFINDQPMTNTNAIAGALEYIWYKQLGKNKTRKELAEVYEVSPATMSKYIRFIERYDI